MPTWSSKEVRIEDEGLGIIFIDMVVAARGADKIGPGKSAEREEKKTKMKDSPH